MNPKKQRNSTAILGWGMIAAALGLLIFVIQQPELGSLVGDLAGSDPSASAEAASEDLVAPALPPEVAHRFSLLVGNMWWHQESMGGKLDLRDEQVQKMDTVCLEFLRSRWTRRSEEPKWRGAYAEALKALDLEAARQAVEVRERRAVERAGAMDRMTLGVLEMLTPEQLELAGKELPTLFSQPWLRGVSGAAPKRPDMAGKDATQNHE